MGLFDGFRKKLSTDNENHALSGQSNNKTNEDILLECVDRLYILYQQKSTGFYESEADEVRKVGKELNDAGGMELMVKAYNIFAKQRPECARNLESSWGGIGEWMG